MFRQFHWLQWVWLGFASQTLHGNEDWEGEAWDQIILEGRECGHNKHSQGSTSAKAKGSIHLAVLVTAGTSCPL